MITKKIVNKDFEVIDTLSCDNCKRNIPLVYPDHDYTPDTIQGSNMLHILFEGGYGMYVDGRSDVHLCHLCATKLRKAFSLFEKVLRRTSIGSCDWRNNEAWEQDGDSLVDDVIQVKLETERE
jgi:hypothetical protein